MGRKESNWEKWLAGRNTEMKMGREKERKARNIMKYWKEVLSDGWKVGGRK